MKLALRPIPKIDASVLPWINENFQTIALAFENFDPPAQSGLVNFSTYTPVGDGLTDDKAKLDRAVQDAQGKYLLIPGGRTYFVSAAVNIDGVLGIIGLGDPAFKSTVTNSYIFRKSGTTRQSLFLDGLIFDCANAATSSGVRLQYVDNCFIHRCTFRNHNKYGLAVGMDNTVNTDVNTKVFIENCKFSNTSTAANEHIFYHNITHGGITKCEFSGSSSNYWCLGLVQNLKNINVEGNDFGVGIKGAYYTVSNVEGITVEKNLFRGWLGLRGAQESPFGAFGGTYAKKLIVTNNTFKGVSGAECLRISNVDGFEIHHNLFESNQFGCIMDLFTGLITVGAQAAINGSIDHNIFLGNNVSGLIPDTNCPIWFASTVPAAWANVLVDSNQFRNNVGGGQTRNIVFDGNGTVRNYIGYKVNTESNIWDTTLTVRPVRSANNGTWFPPGRVGVANADYNVTINDRVISQVGTLTTGRFLNLPAAALFNPGDFITLIEQTGSATGANPWRVARTGTDLINNTTFVDINGSAATTRRVYSDGVSNWTM